MNDEIIDADSGASPAERPQFLTVLCILTFIGSGLGLLGSLFGLLLGDTALERFAPVTESEDMLILQLIGLASPALCLTGALQMWALKKIGFTLYVVGSGIYAIVMVINAMSIPDIDYGIGVSREVIEAAQSMVWIGVFFGIGICVAFVLMYNANRKFLIN